MINIPIIVKLATYKFDLEGFPKESKRKWYRFADVLEYVNNILLLRHEPQMRAEDFYYQLSYIKPRVIIGTRAYSEVVARNKKYGSFCLSDSKWVSEVIDGDMYIGAKLANDLIFAVRHPILSSFRYLFRKD